MGIYQDWLNRGNTEQQCYKCGRWTHMGKCSKCKNPPEGCNCERLLSTYISTSFKLEPPETDIQTHNTPPEEPEIPITTIPMRTKVTQKKVGGKKKYDYHREKMCPYCYDANVKDSGKKISKTGKGRPKTIWECGRCGRRFINPSVKTRRTKT